MPAPVCVVIFAEKNKGFGWSCYDAMTSPSVCIVVRILSGVYPPSDAGGLIVLTLLTIHHFASAPVS